MSSAVQLVSEIASPLERSVRTKAQDLRSFSSSLTMYPVAARTARELVDLVAALDSTGGLARFCADRFRELEERYQRLGRPVAATDGASRAYLRDVQDFSRELATRVLAAYPKHVAVR